MSDDTELLRRYAEDGNEAAFADLVRQHLSLVYNTALRHVGSDVHSAQDVAQIVFTDLARKAHALANYPTLGGWLYARSRYASLDALRSRRRRQLREEKAHLMHEIAAGAESSVDWERLRPVIDRAMDGLSDKDRNAVYLRYFEGRSFAEVGARFDLSEEAVRKRVERAMEKLRRSLKRLGVTSTTGALALAIAKPAGAASPIGLAETISGAALAAAGVPVSGLVALLQLMNTTKLMVGTALAGCLLLTGFSVHEQRLLREARAALALEGNESTAAARELRDLKQQAGRVDLDLADLQGAGAHVRTPAAGAMAEKKGKLNTPALVPGTRRWAVTPLDRELIKDPDVRKNFKLHLSATLNAVYGPLFKSLGLSQTQIEALENLKLQQNQNESTAVLTLRPDGVTPNEVRQSVQNLLGEAGYQEYVQYDRTVWGGGVVASGLAGNLYDSGNPLTAEQASQLTRVLATSSGEGYSYASSINWAIALPGAQEILSPAQFAVLQNIATIMSANADGDLWDGISPLAAGAIGNSFVLPVKPNSLEPRPR